MNEIEPIQACIVTSSTNLTPLVRNKIAQCLGWQENSSSLCGGSYNVNTITPLPDGEVRLMADEVSFYQEGQSELKGNIEVQENNRIVNADTAYVYRDAKTNKVKQIELLGDVKYSEPGRLMIARKAIIKPDDKSGRVEDVIYRFNTNKRSAVLPAWGQASLIERFTNKDYLLQKATYSTCHPTDKAWQIEADSIELNNAEATGVARHAKLRIQGVPVFYSPYLSFPTSKERKSGFLLPVVGSSNVGGFDLALPYYWNIAPNYDATITPHLYTKRGLMMGGQFRYLTPNSFGFLNGRFLPHDKSYNHFLKANELYHPQLKDRAADRWSFQIQDSTMLAPDLHLGINVTQVSDDYFLQDFSSNLAILTERQLLRQGDLTYTTEHWLFKGLVQSYQTLHPINQTPIDDVYQRLPQLFAHGAYDELPFNATLSLHGQYDYFQWPNNALLVPGGGRYHFNPILSAPQLKPWGYFTPSVQAVENHYNIHNQPALVKAQHNRFIPRYSLDTGLFYERDLVLGGRQLFTQTLEPRLYYLYVPYSDQSVIPVYDSGYMIFNSEQLFRTNRFSGFDRIGDSNQLSYALTSRFLSNNTGAEKISLSVGQIRYFQQRRVQLCQSYYGNCYDNPLTLGYLSPFSNYSPIASRAVYHFNPAWVLAGDYVWDPATKDTNNGHVNFHYQPGVNKIVGLGYTYLVNGDITQIAYNPYRTFQDNPLHQATFSYAWPFSDRWSTLGAYNYNISKRYEMMSFLGVQYDSCCWAVRLIGGRTFKNLDSNAAPRYNNNIYLQILLKGLGSAGTSDPSSRLRTFLPGYTDVFHR